MNLPISRGYLEAALQDGFSQGKIKLVHRTIGELALPTGRLIACDPFVDPEAEPFVLNFPQGRFPVILSIAEIAADQRVAFAQVRFLPGGPERWEMMSVGSQDISKLEPGEIFGYPVDSGTGCFIDRSALLLLNEAMRENPDYYETLNAEMEKTYRHTWSWLDAKFGDANLVAFSSGYGDGFYTTYAGFDANGAITTVLTDFGVLPTKSAATDPMEAKPEPQKSGLSRLWDSFRLKTRGEK